MGWPGTARAAKSPVRYLGHGVISGPKSNGQTLLRLLTFRLSVHTGYVVPAAAAVEILAKAHPEAASWWHEFAPHAIRAKRKFLFAPECCELVP